MKVSLGKPQWFFCGITE